MKERQIIKSLKEGDREAFSMLYKQYWEKVYHFCGLYLNNRDVAEDVVQEDELIAVSVRTGKVEVDMPESVMRLLPNEQVIVNNANGEILKKNEDAQKVTAWLQGGLYFNRTPISSVIHDLERMYNQEIVLDPNVVFDDYIYGEHDNKSLEAVLNAIQYSTGIRYRTEGNRIVLYKTSY